MNSNDNIYAKFVEAVRRIKNSRLIIITSHLNPDGDSIGSQLGLYDYCHYLGKEVHIINADPPPYNLEFLPGIDIIKVYDKERDDEIIKNADLIFVLDLNDITRINLLNEPVSNSAAYKIVVDHHIDPKEFADLYITDTEASSTGELIWKIIKTDSDYKFNKFSAYALYTAVMTDTGSFRFPKTDEEVHRIIADLIEIGAEPANIYDEVYNQLPYSAIKLLGAAYLNTELYYNGILALMIITDDMISKANASEDDIENFVEKLLFIKGVKVGVLITEVIARNELRVSFRSKAGFNVREIAAKFGGGGHFEASGSRVYGRNIDDFKSELLAELVGLFK